MGPVTRRPPSQPQLRRGEAAGWGPHPEAARRSLQLRAWKRAPKPGTLRGFACITLPYKGSQLEIDDLPVLMINGKAWAAFPGKPVVVDGVVARIPGTSKVRYVNHIRWGDSETTQRFSKAVVALVRQHDPGAFAGEAEQ
jgi:hypothetical protein